MKLAASGLFVSYFTSTNKIQAARSPAAMHRLRAMAASEQRRRTQGAHAASAAPTPIESMARYQLRTEGIPTFAGAAAENAWMSAIPAMITSANAMPMAPAWFVCVPRAS